MSNNKNADKQRNKIDIVVAKTLLDEQKQIVSTLQKLAFTGVNEQEVQEDFYHPKSAHVLAYIGEELVGWAGIHETEQVFEGKNVKLGGYGICTHPKWQRKGIASKVSCTALDFLKNRGCEVGFLSIDLENTASIKLHQKNGFVMLPRKFSWINSKGELKQDNGGMIAPINSHKLFEQILKGKEVLFIGGGYW